MIRYIFAILFWFTSSASMASVLCIHPQVCNVLNEVIEESALISPHQLPSGDPHHFEPSPKDIKTFMRAEILISPPKELAPWIERVERKRKKEKTLLLKAKKDIFKIYDKGATTHNISHFWLYPELICQFRADIKIFLEALHIKTKELGPCPSKEFLKKLSGLKFNQGSKILLLTHDAIAPFLLKNGLMNVALKSSEHSARITPFTLKKITRYKKLNKTLILLKEKQMEDLAGLNVVEKQSEKSIVIDTLGTYPTSSFSILNSLIDQLGKLF